MLAEGSSALFGAMDPCRITTADDTARMDLLDSIRHLVEGSDIAILAQMGTQRPGPTFMGPAVRQSTAGLLSTGDLMDDIKLPPELEEQLRALNLAGALGPAGSILSMPASGAGADASYRGNAADMTDLDDDEAAVQEAYAVLMEDDDQALAKAYAAILGISADGRADYAAEGEEDESSTSAGVGAGPIDVRFGSRVGAARQSLLTPISHASTAGGADDLASSSVGGGSRARGQRNSYDEGLGAYAIASATHSSTGQRPPPTPLEVAAAIRGETAPASTAGVVDGSGASLSGLSGLQQDSSVSRISRPSTSERSLITVTSRDEYDLEAELRLMLNDERALSVSRSLPVLRQGKVHLPLGGLAGRFEGLPSMTEVRSCLMVYCLYPLIVISALSCSSSSTNRIFPLPQINAFLPPGTAELVPNVSTVEATYGSPVHEAVRRRKHAAALLRGGGGSNGAILEEGSDTQSRSRSIVSIVDMDGDPHRSPEGSIASERSRGSRRSDGGGGTGSKNSRGRGTMPRVPGSMPVPPPPLANESSANDDDSGEGGAGSLLGLDVDEVAGSYSAYSRTGSPTSLIPSVDGDAVSPGTGEGKGCVTAKDAKSKKIVADLRTRKSTLAAYGDDGFSMGEHDTHQVSELLL